MPDKINTYLFKQYCDISFLY